MSINGRENIFFFNPFIYLQHLISKCIEFKKKEWQFGKSWIWVLYLFQNINLSKIDCNLEWSYFWCKIYMQVDLLIKYMLASF